MRTLYSYVYRTDHLIHCSIKCIQITSTVFYQENNREICAFIHVKENRTVHIKRKLNLFLLHFDFKF